ncbi:WD-40 repeat protein [Streptomyces lincolnensis]|uniref:WD-40 repeat protein n=1 Tax=Streptomyces lincolnensis TaxID=1915 RepID=A0A1B1MDM5_STRLN|nr:WD-40 repeat protein [Streptomyces lincolnensis]AXG55473.1 WD-40 repeat protein [Streptomyces lincolnensis]
MTADELRDAVVKPARAVGHLVERELIARLVEDVVDEPGALPRCSPTPCWRPGGGARAGC